jgi:iron complex outermembrane receptor protein
MTLGLCATAEWVTPGIAAAQAVSAAAKPEAVQEIVVTGERKQETLQKAPASVTALSAQVLAEAGVKIAADFVALTPGVSIVVGSAEAADAQVNIRGLNGARDANPNFAFVVDGIVLSDPAAFNRSFADLSQIEIFKGPQGAIYGRDAEAGAIVVTTVKPGPTFEGGTTVGYANNNTFYNQSSISGPLIKDQLFGRLSADYRSTDGFDTNTFTNSKTVDDEKAYDINGRLIWNPTSDWSFDLKASYGHVDAASINFNADFMLPGLTSVFGPAVDENVNSHQFDYVNNIVPDNHQTARELSVKFDHDMSWAKLTGYVQYSNIDNNLLSDGTVAPFGFYNNSNNITKTNVCQTSQAAALASGLKYPAPQNPAFGFLGPYTASTCDGYQYQVRNEIDKSAELRLSSTNNNGLSWSGGVYYLNVDRHVGVSIGNDLGLPILQNLYNPANSQSPTAQEYSDAFTTNVYAAFGSVDYNILSNLVLSAAIRYDVEQRSVHNEVPTGNLQDYINVVAGGPANGAFYPLNPGLIANPNGIPDAHKTFSQPEPRVSLRWDVQPNISLYSTIGVGFKSGGFNSSGTEATI